jgi:hypothetical protein
MGQAGVPKTKFGPKRSRWWADKMLRLSKKRWKERGGTAKRCQARGQGRRVSLLPASTSMPLSFFRRNATAARHSPLAQTELAADHDELEAAFANGDDDDDDVDARPSRHPLCSPADIRINVAGDDSDPDDDPLRRTAGPSSSPASPPLQSGGYDFDSDRFSARQSTSAPRPLSPLPSALPSAAPRTGLARFLPVGLAPFRYARLSPRSSSATYGGGLGNDGVFANLNAKPERIRRRNADGTIEYVGGDDEAEGNKEAPPVCFILSFRALSYVGDRRTQSYETAAADAAPPYWETTIIAPALGPDDMLVDGLPVGHLFGFAWNLLVSMSFQFVGFLLTYLLHTTHAAKNGSRAGLGITLIQYGFYMRAYTLAVVLFHTRLKSTN